MKKTLILTLALVLCAGFLSAAVAEADVAATEIAVTEVSVTEAVQAPVQDAAPVDLAQLRAEIFAGAEDSTARAGEPCGTNYCSGFFFCCNRSCSICAPIGGGCTQEYCS